MVNPHEETAQAPKATEQAPMATAEQAEKASTRQRNIERWLEVITAVMLGIVALATAWSGYQAARWGGEQASLYVEASGLRVESVRDSTLAGQTKLYDITLFNQWLNAYAHGEAQLARIYENRFRPEFLPAFNAWLLTQPFQNPGAPPGPTFMPQYQLSQATQADEFETAAARDFAQGEADRRQSDDYVLNTVFLAVVLFLTAIADRFAWQEVRAAVLIVAAGMLLFGLYRLAVYPVV